MVRTASFTAEKYLLYSLNRIAKNPYGYAVLYVNVSKLKPKNRHPEFVKIFAKMFDGIVGATNGLMFILSNGDFAILGKNIAPETVGLAVKNCGRGYRLIRFCMHMTAENLLIYMNFRLILCRFIIR